MPSKKVNHKGEYTSFPGTSVIAPISSESKDYFGGIYQCLSDSPETNKYYSLLPPSSYHMTVCNLFTKQENAPNNWNSFVSDKLPQLQTIHKALETTQLDLSGDIGLVVIDSVIQLQIKLTEKDHESIINLFKTLGLENQVPSFLHITLAYQFKPFNDLSKNLAEVDSEINVLLNDYFLKNGHQISLNIPILTYFENMTQFIEWDGKENPFSSPSFFENILSFFYSFSSQVKEPKAEQDQTSSIIVDSSS